MSDADRLTSRVLTAGLWATLLRTVTYGVGFVRAVVVARLLAPDDVGLFGITLLTIAALEVFTETGFREALIQREKTIEGHLSSAWTVQLMRNALIAAALVAGAPLVAAFFQEPASTMLVRAVSIAVLLSGFENPGVIRFERHLEFGPHFQLKVAGLTADLLVSGFAAYLLQSPWALVLGLVAHRLARTVASYALSGYRPRLELDLEVVKELYGYGAWVFAKRVTHFLAMKGDDILVGRLLGPFALGIYQMAFQIGELAARELSQIVGTVAFPAYSRIQSEPERLRTGYLLTVELVASIVVPVAVVATFMAEPVVLLVLGERWIDVAVVLPILVWSASVRGVVSTAGSIYMALGKPRLSFQVSVLRVVVLFALIVPLARRMGLEGVAWSVLISTLTTIPFALVYVRRIMYLPVRILFRHLAPGFGLAGTAAVPFFMAHRAGWTEPLHLWLATGLALILYVLVAVATHRRSSRGPLRLLALVDPEAEADPPTEKAEGPRC